MPTPAILSGQMDPPPVMPVVEMNFVTGDYEVFQEPVGVETLLYNASGNFADLAIVPGIGLTGLHDDDSGWNYSTGGGTLPPSIRGTTELNARLLEIFARGSLTAVCEVEFNERFVINNEIPFFYIMKDDTFLNTGSGAYVSWLSYFEHITEPPGGFTEGYAYGGVAEPTEYQGGSPYEGSGDRRYRFAGTWCFDMGPAVGVNRYRGGQSVDGTPQHTDVSFGETPFEINHDLKYMTSVIATHLFGVGTDLSLYPLAEDGWYWWSNKGFIVRYLAFYHGRPTWTLPILSRPVYEPVRVGQYYAEVIHDPL